MSNGVSSRKLIHKYPPSLPFTSPDILTVVPSHTVVVPLYPSSPSRFYFALSAISINTGRQSIRVYLDISINYLPHCPFSRITENRYSTDGSIRDHNMCYQPYIKYLCESARACPATLTEADRHPGSRRDRGNLYSRPVTRCRHYRISSDRTVTCNRPPQYLPEEGTAFIHPMACDPCRNLGIAEIQDDFWERFERRFYTDRRLRRYDITTNHGTGILNPDWKNILHVTWKESKRRFWNQFTATEEQYRNNWRSGIQQLSLRRSGPVAFNVGFFPYREMEESATQMALDAAGALAAIKLIPAGEAPEV